ncbi:MAG: hypothetical protein LCH31_02550 [Actinobacteria bacterium]|nr:hypothetical protein [Actinomycetota bacterium]
MTTRTNTRRAAAATLLAAGMLFSTACSAETATLSQKAEGSNEASQDSTLGDSSETVVTDPAEVRRILSANCKTAGPNCTFVAKVQRFETLPKTQWPSYGHAQGNCIEGSKAELAVSQKKTVSWKSMIGVTASGEMGIGPVKVGLEASYETSWGAESSFEEEHRMSIPYGKVAGFYIAAGVLHVEGDFTVIADGKTYKLPNTVFNLPLTKDYTDGDTVIPKGPILPVAWDCPASGKLNTEQIPEIGVPDDATVLDPATMSE